MWKCKIINKDMNDEGNVDGMKDEWIRREMNGQIKEYVGKEFKDRAALF